MEAMGAPCPAWLATHLQRAGGQVPFRCFMDLALNDPEHGFYGAGHAQIGTDGDFVTSPSLGPDFAALLAVQLIPWLKTFSPSMPLSIVEIGPGEGHLAADLLQALQKQDADLIDRIELVLVESAAGMRGRQEQRLQGEPSAVPVRWCSLDQLIDQPVRGVVLAHELLDALPVDRLILRDGELQQLMLSLGTNRQLSWTQRSLPEPLRSDLERVCQRCNINLPPKDAGQGWVSEWHSELPDWFSRVGAGLAEGVLLIVDYALEARRYYTSRRREGTLMAVKGQQAGLDPLNNIGLQDLTSHLCIETVDDAALQSGWLCRGHARQGEALLALGLAQRLHDLQLLPADQLSQAFNRREALLRLVDPAGLGDFRWLLYARGDETERFSLASSADNSESVHG